MQNRPAAVPWTSWWADPVLRAIIALGLTQIISWGTTLYALGILGKPIVADTGWSQGLVFGGLTVGLLVSSVLSAWIGRLIDRVGGRRIMSLGSILSAAGLVLLAGVTHPWAYLAVWAFLGIAMRMTLYDAAFPSLVQVAPSRGRRSISYLTLFGGLASTIFWPIGAWLNADYGWRTTLLVFAAINLLACLPLHWWGLAGRAEHDGGPVAPAAQAATDGPPPLEGRARTVAMVLFGIVSSACAFVFGALAVHLVPLIQAWGVALTAAVALASMKGIAQVAGRLWELLFARKLKPLNLGRVSVAFLPLSLLVLILGGANYTSALVFTLLFGVSNGLVTIVRGAVPLALFGPKGYGAVLGVLATPYLVLNALAPAVFAVLVERAGYRTGALLLLAAGAIALAAMEGMALWHRRRSERSPA